MRTLRDSKADRFRVRFTRSLFLSSLGLFIGLQSCEPKGGTDAAEEPGAGRIFLENGLPAANATIRIYRVEEIPGQAANPKSGSEAGIAGASFITHTDAQGRYRADGLDNGEYNILAELDKAYAYRDSLTLPPGSNPIPPDTLRAPGSVSGYVQVQPQHDPRTVTVELLGTNRYANVDSAGRFQFRDLAAGTYSVRTVTTLAEYTPTFSALSAASGRDTPLRDTLAMIFTGIPAVTGLSVRYDTASGVATLRWNPVKHPLLQDYIIDRMPGKDRAYEAVPELETDAVGANAYDDTLFNTIPYRKNSEPYFERWRGLYEDNRQHYFTWRVRARLKTTAVGPFLEAVSSLAVSPLWVKTDESLSLNGGESKVIGINDSGHIVLEFRNLSHRIKTIRWYDDYASPPLREVSPMALEGNDTLPYRSGPVPSVSNIYVMLIDEAGLATRDQISITVRDDTPDAKATASAAILNYGDTLTLHGSATDLGTIKRWEWALGKGAPFRPVSGPDTSFPAGFLSLSGDPVPFTLRVTDDDGRSDTATVLVLVNPWKNLKAMPHARHRFPAWAQGGKIYAMGGWIQRVDTHAEGRYPTSAVDMYDPATDTWYPKASMHFQRGGASGIEYGGKFLVVGGEDANPKALATTEFYDPGTDAWRDGPSLDNGRFSFGLAKKGDSVLAIQGVADSRLLSSVETYDSVNGKWSQLSILPLPSEYGIAPPARSSFSAFTLAGRTICIGGEETWSLTYSPSATMQILDIKPIMQFTRISKFPPYDSLFTPYDGTMSWGAQTTVRSQSRGGTQYGETLLMAGGYRSENGDEEEDVLESFDPVSGKTQKLARIYPPRISPTLVVSDGRLYLLGGTDTSPFPQVLTTVQVLAAPLDSLLRR